MCNTPVHRFCISGFSDNSSHCHQPRIFHVVVMFFSSGKLFLKIYTCLKDISPNILFEWFTLFCSLNFNLHLETHLMEFCCCLNGLYLSDTESFPVGHICLTITTTLVSKILLKTIEFIKDWWLYKIPRDYAQRY